MVNRYEYSTGEREWRTTSHVIGWTCHYDVINVVLVAKRRDVIMTSSILCCLLTVYNLMMVSLQQSNLWSTVSRLYTTVVAQKNSMMERREKGKLEANDTKRVTTGAHFPRFWVFRACGRT